MYKWGKMSGFFCSEISRCNKLSSENKR